MELRDTRRCSILYYATGVLFLLTPWFSSSAGGGPEVWLPLGLGGFLMAVTLAAEDRMGPVRLLRGPLRHHLEVIGSMLLAVSPWVFAFDETAWRPHLFIGQVGIGVSLLTEKIAELPTGRLTFALPGLTSSTGSVARHGTSQNRPARSHGV